MLKRNLVREENMKYHNIKIVCAWCNAHMGQKNGFGTEIVAHSICSDCLIEWRKSTAKSATAQRKQAQEKTFATTA
jgi:hypothetical protein